MDTVVLIEIIVGVLFALFTLLAIGYFCCLYCKNKVEERKFYEDNRRYDRLYCDDSKREIKV
jgi:hypothetical protein